MRRYKLLHMCTMSPFGKLTVGGGEITIYNAWYGLRYGLCVALRVKLLPTSHSGRPGNSFHAAFANALNGFIKSFLESLLGNILYILFTIFILANCIKLFIKIILKLYLFIFIIFILKKNPPC